MGPPTHTSRARSSDDRYFCGLTRSVKQMCQQNRITPEAENNVEVIMADIGLLIHAFFTPIVILVGLVGNYLCLMVFRVKRLRSSPTGNACATILSALSAVDLLVLICHILPEWIYNGLPVLKQHFYQSQDFVSHSNKHTDLHEMDANRSFSNLSSTDSTPSIKISPVSEPIQLLYKPGLFQIYITITYVLRMMSVWLLVLFTIERYIEVCCPLKNSLFRTRHKVNGAIGLVLGLTLLTCSYKPILSCIVDSRYAPADIETTGRSKSATAETIVESNVMTTSTNETFHVPVTSKIPTDLETHEGAKLAFVLDSCYAFLLTVLPLFIISGLSLGIITHLSHHNKLLCMAIQTNSTGIPQTTVSTKTSAEQITCCQKWNVCGCLIRFKNSVSDCGQTNGHSQTSMNNIACTYPGRYNTPVPSKSSSSYSQATYPNRGNHIRSLTCNCSASQQESTIPSDSCIRNMGCSKCRTSRPVKGAKKVTTLPPMGIQTEWSAYRARWGDHLGRQFVLTLFAISACFLLLNVPYLIMWICRWFQVRRSLYDMESSETMDKFSQQIAGPVDIADLTKSLVRTIMDQAQAHNKSGGSLAIHPEGQFDWLQFALPISRTIFSFNYCVNIFLYSLVGRYFRRELARLVWGWKYAVVSRLRPKQARRMAKQHQQGLAYNRNRIRVNVWCKNVPTGAIPLEVMRPDSRFW
ncbi:hypothetical protein T265_01310 [Opisthorchis viverrini]|uniref:G-protein coupled receptors family 1 profile domain-containing protein n=1 Tax=Opisthorchis viverrini TaxID=6198 RepID=A0A074ZZW9_OPIVI|nr:hypothetical protein T265_01310 [Opisthorchis viverrini]KER32621.1 hypothetical protein T265_01310 [Opisthorchis viverrini]